jgi:hypothetical protein
MERGPAAKRDCEWISYLIGALRTGEKFLMPNKGRLIDNRMPAEEMIKNLKLPFPITICEFSYIETGEDDVSVGPGQIRSSKRIVVCIERPDDTGYFVTSVDYLDKDAIWQYCPIMQFISYDLKLLERDDSTPLHPLLLHYVKDKNPKTFNIQTYVTSPWLIEFISQVQGIPRPDLAERLDIELSSDWQTVVDLCNVLNCSNVVMDKLAAPKLINKKRERSGKTPFYEYHVLKIKADRVVREGRGAGHGDRLPPKEHIRRGHIRHYHRDDPDKHFTRFIKQQWIGDRSRGRVEKDYEILT